MAKPKITIIGLGITGASMGLALQLEDTNFEIVGHDKSQEANGLARKLKAVDRTDWNLHSSCENADLVITAVPLVELDELYEQIAEDLKPGCLVLGVVSLMEPAIAAADRSIPQHAHFVAGHPVLTGVGGTLSIREDLFQNAVFSLAGNVDTDPDALQLASDFIDRIGATPLYVDAVEHDGIMAEVEQLPRVVAAALMRLASSSRGWREARRLAGRQFAQATELGGSADQLASSLRVNQEKIIVRLRQMQLELGNWIELLETQPEEAKADPLLTALEDIEYQRNNWAIHAELVDWDESAPLVETKPQEESGLMRQMFLGNLFGRRPTDKR